MRRAAGTPAERRARMVLGPPEPRNPFTRSLRHRVSRPDPHGSGRGVREAGRRPFRRPGGSAA